MIDLRLVRTDPDAVRVALGRRHAPGVVEDLDRLIALDAELRQLTSERDAVRAEIKQMSAAVGKLRRSGSADDRTEAERLQAASRSLGEREAALERRHEDVASDLRRVQLVVPNLPHPEAPDGAGDSDNPVVLGPINLPERFPEHRRVPHWDIGAELGILDNERATKIAGSMFTLQRGLGARLSRALTLFALDLNSDAFEEIRPPSLVTTATLTASGQLPKFADDAYAIERDDLWCIPTAEVPLTSMYADEVIDAADLPVRLMAATPCYRREAGSAGRDTRGMLRTHEFDKVEILCVAAPDQASDLLQEMVTRAASAIDALDLPYRVIEICTGDLGQSHHRSFDLEVYAPGADQWLEVSSVSWFSDYQARRANLRFRRPSEKGTEIAHTLNGSALAVPRVWAAILENHRQSDGSVAIPEVLHPYMGGAKRIEPR